MDFGSDGMGWLVSKAVTDGKVRQLPSVAHDHGRPMALIKTILLNQ